MWKSWKFQMHFRWLWWQNVSNKAKGQISERVLQENKARQIFRKMNISYTPIHIRACCVSRGTKCSCFFFFFCNTSFEIHPFALLPTKTCLDWSLKSIMMKQEDESTYKIKMSYRQSKSPFPLSHLIQTHCLMVLMFCENSLFFWFWWHLVNWRYISH